MRRLYCMGEIHLGKHSKIKLVVGDVIKEVNRFNKTYVLYQITKIVDDWCEMLVLDSTCSYRKGKTVGGNISCHYGGHKTAYLTYYIPCGRILYGHKTTAEAAGTLQTDEPKT